MKRLLLLWLLPLLAAAPLKAEVRLSVKYSESADLFSAMDNVSDWWEGFVNPRYREEWVERFGWSAADQMWADRYAEYRHRTYSDESQGLSLADSPHGLFGASTANSAKSDPLASYLLDQPDIETALANFGTFAQEKDAKMLLGFYRHFEPKWRQLLAESGPLSQKAEALQILLATQGIGEFVGQVSDFYQVTTEGEFRVFFTRFPPGTRSGAEVVAGRNLLLHSPTALDFPDGDWDTIVMHELVHYISARQPEDQKRRLTDRFLARCAVPNGAKRLWMIEEPLAVAVGQAAYSQAVRGKPLDPRSNWYAVPWIDVSARTLATSVVIALESGVTIEQTTIAEEAADRCRDFVLLAEQLRPPS